MINDIRKPKSAQRLSYVSTIIIVVSLQILFYRPYNKLKINFSIISLSKIILTIHIHSSNKTMFRLIQNYMQYRKMYPYVKYYAVFGNNISEPYPDYINIIHSNCSDTRNAKSGLVCRDVASYDHFLDHPEDGNWLYRAMDDTILHIDNMLTLISKLERLYDPTKNIVFRGCQNFAGEGKVWFLGGGAGWLSSREMIRLHSFNSYSFMNYFEKSYAKQDDTTETIIINKIFTDLDQWRDYSFVENCGNCVGHKILKRDFSGIGNCENQTDVYMVNDIIAFHSFHLKRNEEMIDVLKSNFKIDLYYYKTLKNNKIILCRNPKKVGIKNNFDFMLKHAKAISVDDMVKKSYTYIVK